MPSSETAPLLVPRETPFERQKKLIALICILSVHTLHSVAFYTMFLQLLLFLDVLKTDLKMSWEMPSIIILTFQAIGYLVMPMIGGILGDVTLGRYRAIFVGACFELLGTTIFLVVAALQKQEIIKAHTSLGLTIAALVAIAIGMGFLTSNILPFGAQQVDTGDFGRVQSFMKWYTWCLNLGQLIAFLPMVYIIKNVNGFLIGAVIQVFAMALSIAVLIFGKPKYKMLHPEGKTTLLQLAAGIKQHICCAKDSATRYRGINYESEVVMRILKQVILLMLLFSMLITYEGIYFQMQNTYLEQSDKLQSPANIPKGFMYIFNPLAVLVGLPLLSWLNCYDATNPRYFIRLCIGVTFGVFSALMAGLVEFSADKPDDMIGEKTELNISIWTQIPQFAFVGIGEVFNEVAGYEIAYGESPPGIEGMMTALFTATFGAGSCIGLFLYHFLTKPYEKGTKDKNIQWLYFTFAIVTAAMVPLIIIQSRVFQLGKYRKYRSGSVQETAQSDQDRRVQTSFNHSDDNLSDLDSTIHSQGDILSDSDIPM